MDRNPCLLLHFEDPCCGPFGGDVLVVFLLQAGLGLVVQVRGLDEDVRLHTPVRCLVDSQNVVVLFLFLFGLPMEGSWLRTDLE